MKILPTPVPAPETPPTQESTNSTEETHTHAPRPRSYRPVNRLIGQAVRIDFVNGAILFGTLTEVWQYEIIVVSNSAELNLMKHAIAMIQADPDAIPASDPEPAPEPEPEQEQPASEPPEDT